MMKRSITLCSIAVAALAFSGAGFAANSSSQSGDQGQTQSLMKDYRADAKQLKQIHDKTMKANPDLAKQQDQFQAQVKSAVEDHGYNVDQGQKRMQSMAKKLQDDDTSKDEKSKTMKKFQAERQKMMKARKAAMNDPKVKKAGEKLENDTISAMKKQNSKTDDLLSDMKSKRSKLQAAKPSSAKQPKASQ